MNNKNNGHKRLILLLSLALALTLLSFSTIVIGFFIPGNVREVAINFSIIPILTFWLLTKLKLVNPYIFSAIITFFCFIAFCYLLFKLNDIYFHLPNKKLILVLFTVLLVLPIIVGIFNQVRLVNEEKNTITYLSGLQGIATRHMLSCYEGCLEETIGGYVTSENYAKHSKVLEKRLIKKGWFIRSKSKDVGGKNIFIVAWKKSLIHSPVILVSIKEEHALKALVEIRISH